MELKEVHFDRKKSELHIFSQHTFSKHFMKIPRILENAMHTFLSCFRLYCTCATHELFLLRFFSQTASQGEQRKLFTTETYSPSLSRITKQPRFPSSSALEKLKRILIHLPSTPPPPPPTTRCIFTQRSFQKAEIPDM